MKKLIVIMMCLLITSCCNQATPNNLIPLYPVVHIVEFDISVLAQTDTGSSVTILNSEDVIISEDGIVSFKFVGAEHSRKLIKVIDLNGVNSTFKAPVCIMSIGYLGSYKEVEVVIMDMNGFDISVLLGRNWFGGEYLVHTEKPKEEE